MLNLQIQKLHDDFGARIEGIDVSKRLPKELVAALNLAIDKYSFICLPNQSMNDDAQLTLTRQFGNAEPSHTSVGKINYFGTIGNVQQNGIALGNDHTKTVFQTGNNMWHSDASFKPVPAFLSIMSAYETPSEGGETLFVSTRGAYDRLSHQRQQQLDPLVTVHDYVYSRSKVALDAVSLEMAAALPPVRQRLVRTNPNTAVKNLFLGSHVREIEGWREADGRALIDELTQEAVQPQHIYSHSWQAGEVVLWDNRCLLHRGAGYDADRHRRYMRQTRVSGACPTLDEAA